MLAMLIILSGNRAGAMMAFLGTCLNALPLLQRPRRLIRVALAALLLATTGFLLLHDTYGGQRMLSTKNTRQAQWNTNTEIISRAPIFGHGWVYVGSTAGYANLHSMYYQVTAEMGFVGLVMFLVCSGTVLVQWGLIYRRLGRVPIGCEFAILPLTFIASVMVLGLVETAGMAGTTPDALFWGFGLGLIDRLPTLLQLEFRAMRRRWRYSHTTVPGVA
jgi:O-antigen ligase